ncbi:hypothetical protein PSQ19_14480 [Devosia algicola]|uniref:LPS export ABC transporter periplasmic protein LptC n=1 Tax=Devosia algicola TaxID=3026418 RepID=A0ABY7YL33_9HYPH|nr:hypothetical protein [Devosia algicola]WDR01902.1 hypothetical protein PSQ19_14480 [Devosia algicola]
MSAPSAARRTLYRQLAARNRRVAGLRLIVPTAGVVIFVIIIGQIFISSLTARFGIGQIDLSSDSITIQQPEYSGRLEDGSLYRVDALSARAAATQPDIIELSSAALAVDRASGTSVSITAPAAQLDTTNQLVLVKGLAKVEESDGTISELNNSVFDWSAQTLTSDGPVRVDYADGTSLVGKSLFYDTKTAVWTFHQVTVTLPSTPGAATQ